MSYVIPDPHGPAYKWLAEVDPATVTEVQFRAALDNYIAHATAQGISPDKFMDPDVFFQPGDLQIYENIRISWSLVPKGRPCPGLASMLTAVKPIEKHRTFREDIELQYAHFRQWCVNANLDPDNLNETKKERDNRLASARMRKYRGRLAESDITDPEEMGLVRLLRIAKDNAKAGHAWFRGVEADAKAAYDAAVEAAKLARLHTVSEARVPVAGADKAVVDAQAALDQYRINK